MYTKKIVLTAVDEYLFLNHNLEHYNMDLNINNTKEYYNVKLVDLGLSDNLLYDFIEYLVDELNVPMEPILSWKTINDVCNAFKFKIKNRKEVM